MPHKDRTTTLLDSCRRCLEASEILWKESRDAVRVTREAVSASRMLIERSDRTIERLRMIAEDLPEEPRDSTRTKPDDLFEMISDRTFDNELVVLDGRHFIGCQLSHCTLQYGGQPVILETTSFHGCRFRFTAEAALTVQLLETFDLMLVDDSASYTAVPSTTSRQQLPN